MQRSMTCGALAAALLASGVPAASMAQESNAELAQMRAEMAAMRAELAELKARETAAPAGNPELREATAAAQQDAAARSSFKEEGLSAGHDGKKFMLSDPEGNFLMNLGGQLQFRYIYNSREATVGTDIDDGDNLAGFQFRRMKLKGDGYIADPKLEFFYTLANDRDSNNTILEDAGISYEFDNGVSLQGGRFKAPFAFDELNSSSRQQTVERALVTEQFTVGFTEGVQLGFEPMEDLGIKLMYNDGAGAGESGNGDFNETPVDFAFTARADYKIGGSKDFTKGVTSWTGDEMGLNFGVAAHHQAFKSGVDQAAGPLDALSRVTADVLFNQAGLSLFGAVYLETQDAAAGGVEADPFGFLVQAGYTIDNKWEPFARYEFIDTDVVGADEISVITAGVNYYLKKHSAKFTIDGVYAVDPLTGIIVSDGLGLQADSADEDGQFALRAQFQLLF